MKKVSPKRMEWKDLKKKKKKNLPKREGMEGGEKSELSSPPGSAHLQGGLALNPGISCMLSGCFNSEPFYAWL